MARGIILDIDCQLLHIFPQCGEAQKVKEPPRNWTS